MRRLLVILVALIVAAPARAQITIPNSFSANTVADPNAVNANFNQLGNLALNRTSGTMTGTLTVQTITPAADNTYALGDGAHRVSAAYVADGSNIGNLSAANLASGTVATARLGSGSPSSATFLRGDSSWAAADAARTVVARTSSYTAGLGEISEITSGTLTINLPLASSCTASNYIVGIKNETSNPQTILRQGSDTIDGATSFTTAGVAYESYDFVCNAAKTGWMVR